MTTHRLLEPITFVSWSPTGKPLHIRRPRSQKGVAYCDERVIETRRLPLVRDFTIQHPDQIPLEVRVERDFLGLCGKCARTFYNEVAGENPGLRWSGDHITVPIVWSEIFVRTDFDKLEREHEAERGFEGFASLRDVARPRLADPGDDRRARGSHNRRRSHSREGNK